MHTLISDIDHIFKKYSSKTAIIQCDGFGKTRQFTDSQLEQLSERINALYKSEDLSGYSVAIFMRRSIDHIAAMIGALSRGATFYSVNPMVSKAQISHMISSAKTKLLLCDNSTLLKLVNLSVQETSNLNIIHIQETELNPVQIQALQKISATISIQSISIDQYQTLNHQPYDSVLAQQILFTSGSTGSPKGVLIGSEDLRQRAWSEADSYQIQPTDVLLNVLPFSFDVGCNQAYTSLISGSTLIILNSWLARDIIQTTQEFCVTGISGVPSIWQSLLAANTEQLQSFFQNLRYITISAGDLNEHQLTELMGLTNGTSIYKTYGQTETFRSAMLMPHELKQKPSSVGKPPANVKVAIVRADGSQASKNEIGEIIHTGTGTMDAYIGDNGSTQQKRRSSPPWLGVDHAPIIYTGDRGKIDEEGFLYVLGRMDRMLKIRGNRIYPEEIEAKLLLHPLINEAVVLAAEGMEQLFSAIRLSADSAISRDELTTFLSHQLPSYMLPSHFEILQEFPRTSTGKVDFKAISKILCSTKLSTNTLNG